MSFFLNHFIIILLSTLFRLCFCKRTMPVILLEPERNNGVMPLMSVHAQVWFFQKQDQCCLMSPAVHWYFFLPPLLLFFYSLNRCRKPFAIQYIFLRYIHPECKCKPFS